MSCGVAFVRRGRVEPIINAAVGAAAVDCRRLVLTGRLPLVRRYADSGAEDVGAQVVDCHGAFGGDLDSTTQLWCDGAYLCNHLI